ncbi:putative laminin subunit alpha [Apostichopus japonicus]|uniref:Putative laminin subunit alpha n=1 Tax=Stichopus japonicus TaxID=307972 RepID=A0A2G8JYT3_STIJA|nr:putative laminin subunit alpha [Apostichopus japonicus]
MPKKNVVSLVNDRPGADNFSYSETLQEWTKATNIRLRLLRTNTLLGHLMGLARQDPTVTRRYYYSIKDISIGGRCVCNGHADTCDTPGPDDRLICTCSHNTCGSECEICCPGFVQKKWKPATLEDSNECEPCNCHEHSSDCYYDEEVSRNRLSLDISGRYDGGGVCIDCQHNTAGVNCELCEDGYYRLGNQALESPSVCEACDCDPYFSTGNCAPITGQCECRPRFTGPDCGECNEGYYDFPTCKPCDCNINGTENKVCLPSGGQCPCKVNYAGQFCDQCERGFYDFPACLSCDCDRRGSRGGSCDEGSGQCRCRDTYGGRTCDECANGFYGFPNCQDCSCNPFGVTDEVCEPSTGACICKVNFEGRCDTCAVGYYGFPECRECGCDSKGSQYEGCSEGGQCYCQAGFDGLKCDMCANGYYRYPDCLACDCSRSGSRSILCVELTGQCSCRRGYQGRTCDSCAEGFYNYPNCEECNCDPAGVIERPGQPTGRCGQTQGACTCKANVIGRACDSCAPLYYNLQRSNPAGCESCDCFIEGTVSGLAVCDVTSGQCLCKAAVGGQQCHECKDGYYRLEAGNAFGCVDCGCDVGGSISNVCDKNTGQCVCRARVSGRNCAQPAQLHFFPSLHQIKFEIESGFTPSGTRPRIGYDSKEFPEFSYLGYAVMSSIQPVVMVSIDVDRQSIYRIVLRYLYDGSSPATGHITLTPSSGDIGSEQISNIVFIPGPDPQFVTIEGGGVIMPFVLNRGEWTARIEAPEGALLDYLVLLPSAFYEATVLIQSVADPCIPNAEQERCNYYVFPSYDKYPNARGVDGLYYDINTGQYIRVTPFADEFIRDELDVIDLAHLDEDQVKFIPALGISQFPQLTRRLHIVVEYYGGGPGQQMGTITVTDGQNRMQGIVNFYNCSYLCRSVVVSPRGDLEIFNIENNQISVVLEQLGDPFFLAVSSVIAIPVDNFHYDFITPSLECVRTASGECLGSNHPIPPDSTMIDFVDPTGQDPKPPNMFIPTTTVRYISTTDGITNVYVEIHLLPPGEYVFVVHYYQPENSGFDVNFRILGEFDSEGIFNAGYCPHISGCRVVVTLPDGSNEIDLTGLGQSIEVSIPGRGNHTLWIDYILAIPADQYTDDILNEIPLDTAGEFITFCGSDNFFITKGINASRWASSPDLCKDAVFSISTEFNNGAFPCDCNPAGSRRFECEPIGGQCSCRANVVGRQCDGCAIGYYNFPACRPCRCPTGVCNEVTGDCECPQNVVGNQCDQCAVATYGYDPLAGCVDCDCDDRGNLGSEECDPVSGQCRCKPNVGGRRCDQCLPGYYQYPLCLKCDCESAGTLSQICDQVTAQCLCKDNVIGEQCDQCPVGTFDLSEGNTQGCLSCFCFGVTDDCKSYTRSRQPIAFRRMASDQLGQPSNQLNSYGGRLSFRVMNNPKQGRGDQGATAQPIRRPDVVIGGNGINIIYSNLEQPQPSSSLTMDIKLIEENFQYSFSGRPVSREEFMMVIGNIDQFEIRAQYFDSIVDSSLSDIVFETTHRDGNGDSASSVERCRCPPEYTGLSCERCAQGHYRISRGTFLGQCVPCQCNNHTNECDEETGYCLNCEDDTSGAQCQTCRTGYHGNALSSIPGDGCEVCACPRPSDDHNYAETCGFDANNNQYCICLEGHTGKYCDMCEDGYYGDPSKPNNQCQRCDCSENSDSSLFGPECDSLYGNCLRCRPDTTGEHCEDCADWYYGDAVNRKDCRPCDCDRYGSDSCDRSTGQCTCKPNVVGPRCDRCEANYYNFESGFGCTPCECGLASVGSQCDLSTGECVCRPGVEGRNCDQCSEGFYRYSRQGCRACSCAANLRCDPDTGECLCPEGAIGPNCDQCEDRYVLTKDGCLPCDDCVHLLLDILEDMDFGVSANVSTIPNISVGLDTIKRLKAINESIADIKNYTDAMESNNQKVRPEIEDSSDNLDGLKKIAKRTLKGASRADDKSHDLANDTATTLQRAKDILAKIENAFNSIKDQAGNMTHPMQNQTEDFDDLLQRALEILEEIRGRNHSGMVNESDVELEAAKELLDRVLGLTNASSGILGRLMNVSKQLDDFIDKLEELSNLTAEARDIIDAVNDTIDIPTDIKSIGDEITNIYTMSGDEIDRALDLLDQAREYLLDAAAAVEVTGANASALSSAHNKLETEYGPLKDALNISRELVANAMAHAVNLTAQADYLERLLVSTKELAENALNAANAYKDIVSAIEEAEKAALAAKNASTLADEAASGFGNKPQKSLKISNKLVKKGEKTNKTLGALEAELNASMDAVRQARDKNNGVEYDLSEIERGMRAIPSEESDCEIKVCALDNDACKPGFTGANCNVAAFSGQLSMHHAAMDASMRAEAAAGMVGHLIDQLPMLEDLVTTHIPEGVMEANRNIDEVQPQNPWLAQSLTDKHEMFVNISSNVLGNLDYLREQIDNARSLAQGIQIAAKLESDSSVQLRSLQLSDGPQSVNSISMYFTTTKPDALLFFAGGPGASEEYLALEIEKSEIKLKYNLGDVDVEVPLAMNVADGQWHQVVVER